jgi:hypothetical protein
MEPCVLTKLTKRIGKIRKLSTTGSQYGSYLEVPAAATRGTGYAQGHKIHQRSMKISGTLSQQTNVHPETPCETAL